MIIVHGSLRLSPDDLPVFRDAAEWVLSATRAEAGCIEYIFAEDVLEPGVIRISERWESEAAMQAHMVSAHIEKFSSLITPLALKLMTYSATDEHVLADHLQEGDD